MKVLVTGGAGFIGAWLVDKLVDKGFDVVVVDNFITGKKENVNSRVKFYEMDIVDSVRLNEIFEFEKPEIVFHLAAQTMVRKSIEDPLFDVRTNVMGTISVLEACRKNNVSRVIYTSTGGARVGEPKYLPVDEKHPLNPCSPYGISKHSAEHYVWMYNQLYDLDYLIYCFGNVYGPRDNPETKRVIPLFIDIIKKGETPKIFGDGEQTRDFIYVIDLVDFMIDSMDKKSNSMLYHLAYGKQISVNEIFSLIKDVSGFERNAKHVDAIKGEVRDIVLDIRKANEELGWNPKTDIRTGIEKTWEWFKGR